MWDLKKYYDKKYIKHNVDENRKDIINNSFINQIENKYINQKLERIKIFHTIQMRYIFLYWDNIYRN